MKSIANWLIRIETIAEAFYRDAAAYFEDTDLKAFLEHAARDEARHAQIMMRAAAVLKKHPEVKSAILVDSQIKEAVEGPFLENQKRLRAGTMTRSQLIDCIIATEFTEWNDIFIYVVSTLKDIDPSFKSAAASIQHHLKHTAHFLAASGTNLPGLEKIKNLGTVWTERILIMEDDPYLQELFEAVLDPEGTVDLAEDGKAGLQKIHERYYRLIVSDVTMPGLDGISVFHRVKKQYPNIGDRYLFLTGNPDTKVMDYFKTHQLRYLTKPASIHAIKCAALEILHDLKCN